MADDRILEGYMGQYESSTFTYKRIEIWFTDFEKFRHKVRKQLDGYESEDTWGKCMALWSVATMADYPFSTFLTDFQAVCDYFFDLLGVMRKDWPEDGGVRSYTYFAIVDWFSTFVNNFTPEVEGVVDVEDEESAQILQAQYQDMFFPRLMDLLTAHEPSVRADTVTYASKYTSTGSKVFPRNLGGRHEDVGAVKLPHLLTESEWTSLFLQITGSNIPYFKDIGTPPSSGKQSPAQDTGNLDPPKVKISTNLNTGSFKESLHDTGNKSKDINETPSFMFGDVYQDMAWLSQKSAFEKRAKIIYQKESDSELMEAAQALENLFPSQLSEMKAISESMEREYDILQERISRMKNDRRSRIQAHRRAITNDREIGSTDQEEQSIATAKAHSTQISSVSEGLKRDLVGLKLKLEHKGQDNSFVDKTLTDPQQKRPWGFMDGYLGGIMFWDEHLDKLIDAILLDISSISNGTFDTDSAQVGLTRFTKLKDYARHLIRAMKSASEAQFDPKQEHVVQWRLIFETFKELPQICNNIALVATTMLGLETQHLIIHYEMQDLNEGTTYSGFKAVDIDDAADIDDLLEELEKNEDHKSDPSSSLDKEMGYFEVLENLQKLADTKIDTSGYTYTYTPDTIDFTRVFSEWKDVFTNQGIPDGYQIVIDMVGSCVGRIQSLFKEFLNNAKIPKKFSDAFQKTLLLAQGGFVLVCKGADAIRALQIPKIVRGSAVPKTTSLTEPMKYYVYVKGMCDQAEKTIDLVSKEFMTQDTVIQLIAQNYSCVEVLLKEKASIAVDEYAVLTRLQQDSAAARYDSSLPSAALDTADKAMCYIKDTRNNTIFTAPSKPEHGKAVLYLLRILKGTSTTPLGTVPCTEEDYKKCKNTGLAMFLYTMIKGQNTMVQQGETVAYAQFRQKMVQSLGVDITPQVMQLAMPHLKVPISVIVAAKNDLKAVIHSTGDAYLMTLFERMFGHKTITNVIFLSIDDPRVLAASLRFPEEYEAARRGIQFLRQVEMEKYKNMAGTPGDLANYPRVAYLCLCCYLSKHTLRSYIPPSIVTEKEMECRQLWLQIDALFSFKSDSQQIDILLAEVATRGWDSFKNYDKDAKEKIQEQIKISSVNAVQKEVIDLGMKVQRKAAELETVTRRFKRRVGTGNNLPDDVAATDVPADPAAQQAYFADQAKQHFQNQGYPQQGPQMPNYGQQMPNFNQQMPNFGQQMPGFGQQMPGSQMPGAGGMPGMPGMPGGNPFGQPQGPTWGAGFGYQ